MAQSIYNISLKRDELGDKMGGGIPKYCVGFIEGVNGLGKSILCQRIAFGALQNNNTVTYISTELTVGGFINQMSSLRYNVDKEFLKKKMKFISIFPGIGRLRYQDNLIKRLMIQDKLFDSDIIIIDSLSDFLVGDDFKKEDYYELAKFFNSLSGKGKTVIITASPEDVSEHLIKKLRTVASMYLKLDEKEKYGEKIQFVKIVRYNAAAKEVEKEIPFKVRGGIGIVIDIAG